MRQWLTVVAILGVMAGIPAGEGPELDLGAPSFLSPEPVAPRARTEAPRTADKRQPEGARSGSAVVASVGERSVTRDDLYRAMVPMYGMASLEKLVGRMLLEDELSRQKLTVTDAELEAAWSEAAATFQRENAADLEADLRDRYSLSKDEYCTKVLWLDLAVRKLLQREMNIGESDLFTYFFQHRDRYATPEQIELCHILIDPRMVFASPSPEGGQTRLQTPGEKEWLEAQKRALELQDRLKAGADFAKLAQLHSDDNSTKNAGGNLGLFAKGSMRYAGLEEVAFALKDGEVSDPVKTVMGYHILLRKRTVPAKSPVFEDIKERVRTDFIENVRKTNTTRYLRLLVARAQKEGRLTIHLDAK